MKWYPWLRPSFEQLVGSYQAGRGHHALLLQSLNGMGGEALIYALCRFLMCRQPEGHKSCGHCHSCQLVIFRFHMVSVLDMAHMDSGSALFAQLHKFL